jgi:copper homeostasis protein
VSGDRILEISVENLEAALAAQCGGAHRLELCAELAVGGLTPSDELMRRVRSEIQLPIFAMIRPRSGDFVYADGEIESMRRDIEVARKLGMDGVVLGLLREDRSVDVERTRELVQFARPLPVTFHRAFDECADLQRSLEDVIASGASRILTSGGAATAMEGLSTLKRLVAAAGERIIILPGSGIHAGNIAEVARGTGAREFHSGLGSILAYGRGDGNRFEAEVRKLIAALQRDCSKST